MTSKLMTLVLSKVLGLLLSILGKRTAAMIESARHRKNIVS